MRDCPLCPSAASVTLDLTQGQRVLEHIGAHILFDPSISVTTEPCGLCLQPSTICQYFMKKGKGALGTPKIDYNRSQGCVTKCKFSYSVASRSTSSSPCSNVPLSCPLCAKTSPAVWRYNFEHHLKNSHHGMQPNGNDKSIYELTASEQEDMSKIWERRENVSVKRPRKHNFPPLVVSDAHRASILTRYSITPSTPLISSFAYIFTVM